MHDLKSLIGSFNELFTFMIVFPAIIILGLYLTLRLKCVQVLKLKLSFSSMLRKNHSEQGDITHYQAIAAVLAGNFGTGNISGMAVAITTGGPGALVWMWLMAFLGSSIQYASCLLSVKYREKNTQGEYVGGPMYYLKQGLNSPKLAALFALFAILGAFTVGNFAQVNSLSLPLQEMGINPLLSGIAMAVLAALVILGGIQRMAKVASSVVPVMALLYLGTAIVILIMHIESVLPAFKIMLSSAIKFDSVAGGILGYGLIKTISTGFDRGLFATDAGTGIVPILQASAKTSHPVVDGVVTLVAPFLVMIVCTTTGLVLLVTGAWQSELVSTNMVTYAFSFGLSSGIGHYIVMLALILFAYTTIIAWSCCGEKAVGYLWGADKIKWFRYLYIMIIPIGAIAQVDLVWLLADLSICLMLATNLIGVAGLSRDVIYETKEYFTLKSPQ